MAEVKNAFLKSKMNKDLDSRLVPAGEYRDAVNVQINKSEGDDVGALENVQGNNLLFDFANDLSVSNVFCIGHVVDNLNNIVYLFFTTNELSAYDPSATNAIYSYNNNSSTATLLVGGTANGKFLNFSTQSPITGVNLVENLLFFTDNRNQPRKINVDKASNDSTYYTTEDQISVAKYNPYKSIEVFRGSEQAGAVFPNSGAPFTTTVASDTNDSRVIPVASVGTLTPGLAVQGTGVKEQTVITEVDAVTNEITVNRSQSLLIGTTLSFVRLETTMYDVVNSTLPDGSTANPYYDANFPGDPRFLEDKFVRFSYRFKFDDGEYSILAPFTQGCFIPQQDGCFLEGDEEQTFASTVVGFAENKVNKIDLFIPLPDAGNNIENSYKIKELDIIYKESDALAVQVVETLMVSEISTEAGANDYFVYSYVSTKPYKTLPESELIRVYDKVPVKALSQEVAGNRVIYGNFQDKHTPPPSLDYQVAANQKLDVTENSSSFGSVEYPSSSVKENRNYQIGVVLSDKFGRQSTVILSNNTENATGTGFGADTVYLPYREETSDTEAWEWLGNSLKIQFNALLTGTGIDKDLSTGTPGLYNGDPTDPNYEPLGWYSYKIVVKQIEQDYYNVYTAGAMKGLPYNYDTQSLLPVLNQETSFITLINDNINKVPRDLSEVGPQDKTFRSSVRLFGRVENNVNGFSNIGNEQYLPTDNRISFTTNNIEDLFDLFDVANYINQVATPVPITDQENPFHSFYKSDSNPFIAEFITSKNPLDQFGIINPTTLSNGGFADVNGNQSNVTIIPLNNFIGDPPANGDLVTGTGITVDTYVISYDPVTNNIVVNKNQVSLPNGTQLTFTRTDFSGIENLTILETAPTVSRLDIFWETSTSGLISDLNIDIDAGTGLVSQIADFNYLHLESYSPGAELIQGNPVPHANEFYFTDVLGNAVDLGNISTGPNNVTLTVIDKATNNITSKFTLTQNTVDTEYFSLQQSAGSYFYYEGPSLAGRNEWIFTFEVTIGTSVSSLSPPSSVYTGLTNVNPVIAPKTLSYIPYRQTTIVSWAAGDNTNGSADPTRDHEDITYSLIGAPAQFSLQTYPSTPTTGEVDIIQDIVSYNTFGTFNFTLRATDAGGNSTDEDLSFSIAQPNTPSYFEAVTRTLGQGDGASEFFINGPSAGGNGTSNLPLSNAIPKYPSLNDAQVGYEPPVTSGLNFTTNREVSNLLCPGGSNNDALWRQRIQGTPATDFNVGCYPSTGVNNGSIFFVWVQLNELQDNQESQVYAAIESREVGDTAWNIATDVFGNDCYFSNEYKWEQNSVGVILSEGMINEPFGTPSSNVNDRRLFVESSVPSGVPSPFIFSQGGRVFALNGESLPLGTEYRITIGNVSNNYNAFLISGGVQCGDFNDLGTNVVYMVDDFINPTLFPFATISGNNIYQYEVTTFGTSSNPCSSTFVASSTYYSASPFARYLFAPTPGGASDQIFDLFTNSNLTTKVTYPSLGSPRYARVRRVASTVTSGINPENTKDGSYILQVDGSGNPSILGPCLY